MKGYNKLDFYNADLLPFLLSYLSRTDQAMTDLVSATGFRSTTGLARSLTGDVKSGFLVGTRDVSAGWTRRYKPRPYGRYAQRRSGAIKLIAGLYRRVFFCSFDGVTMI